MTQTMNTLDPRAFGFDLIKDDKKQKALTENLKSKPAEAENFGKSYELAKSLGII